MSVVPVDVVRKAANSRFPWRLQAKAVADVNTSPGCARNHRSPSTLCWADLCIRAVWFCRNCTPHPKKEHAGISGLKGCHLTTGAPNSWLHSDDRAFDPLLHLYLYILYTYFCSNNKKGDCSGRCWNCGSLHYLHHNIPISVGFLFIQNTTFPLTELRGGWDCYVWFW